MHLSDNTQIEVTYSEFGFGEFRERRAMVSTEWNVSTRALESFVERHNPFRDPWYTANQARLNLHEEEIMISLPGDCPQISIEGAIAKIQEIRGQLGQWN